MNTVDRVAQAMYEESCRFVENPEAWDVNPRKQARWKNLARVAIEALGESEPTDHEKALYYGEFGILEDES